VDSEVRRVAFAASTRQTIARLLLVYGRPAPDQRPHPQDDRRLGPLGVAVEQQADGVRIVRVEPDALGDDMGLRDGDLNTKVDTYARPTAARLRRVLGAKGRGDYLFLEVRRGRHVVSFKTQI
jgi:S1-C subfamily serine protease